MNHADSLPRRIGSVAALLAALPSIAGLALLYDSQSSALRKVERELVEEGGASIDDEADLFLDGLDLRLEGLNAPARDEVLEILRPLDHGGNIIAADFEGNILHDGPGSREMRRLLDPRAIAGVVSRSTLEGTIGFTFDNYAALGGEPAAAPVRLHGHVYEAHELVIAYGRAQLATKARLNALRASLTERTYRNLAVFGAGAVLLVLGAGVVAARTARHWISGPLESIAAAMGGEAAPGAAAGIGPLGMAAQALSSQAAQVREMRARLQEEIDLRFSVETERDRLLSELERRVREESERLAERFAARAAEDRAELLARVRRGLRHVMMPPERDGSRDTLEMLEELCGGSDAAPKREAVRLDAWLNTALDAAPLPEGVALRRNITANGTISLDTAAMRRAIAALVDNAARAAGTGDGGWVSVDAVVEDGRLEIRVVDNGPGIPEEVRPHAGAPLFSTRPDGLGLGLAYARRVAELHRGALEIQSEAGKGTAVIVSLPAGAA